MTTDAPDILIAAADAITNRADGRDGENGERSMARTVATFNALTGYALSERDGWVFMAMVKLARSQVGRHVLDDYMDGAAFMALAGESMERKPENKGGEVVMSQQEPHRHPEPRFPTRGAGLVGLVMVLSFASIAAVLN
ncbi:DUF6378 domain-containing protein [Nitrosovibrio sp. Nv6]|uniref:DUF6378 domain-containing protein n=1 Tax=Nitrosovibrio sp. Nv6 TaxID=1855340 RepID=UPI0008BD7745|nr:DUF6378 domain-containing protein [Nitrosovibrio sp. Nv6]SEO65253.1 hypothetical protein SAMN05216316_0715 [Nitrosovibrio sp. Nv6]